MKFSSVISAGDVTQYLPQGNRFRPTVALTEKHCALIGEEGLNFLPSDIGANGNSLGLELVRHVTKLLLI